MQGENTKSCPTTKRWSPSHLLNEEVLLPGGHLICWAPRWVWVYKMGWSVGRIAVLDRGQRIVKSWVEYQEVREKWGFWVLEERSARTLNTCTVMNVHTHTNSPCTRSNTVPVEYSLNVGSAMKPLSPFSYRIFSKVAIAHVNQK